MEKAKMCSDHFVLNCKLCSGEAPSTAPIVQPALIHIPSAAPIAAQETPSVPKQTAPVRSAEAQNVMTVADEYARACESYSEAQAAVAAMMVHIAKMTEVLTNLQNSVVTTRQEKDEAKRRVFDSMKEGA